MRHEIYSSSYYTSSKSSKLIRYDVIKKSDTHYDVMVFDFSFVKNSMSEIQFKPTSFSVTYDDYREKYPSPRQSIAYSMPPTFEGFILECCERHRESLN